MFGKKTISILICVILILLLRNVSAVTPADLKLDYIETPVHYVNTVGGSTRICMIINYVVAIINSLMLILNKNKISKKYFRNVLILTIMLAITNYILSVILESYSSIISYRVNRTNYYMPIFILILQIAISISIFFELRKGKN